MTIATHIASFAVGIVIAWAYARRKIAQAETEALAFVFSRHSLSLSPEDVARRTGC